jgi:hypothetical protein
MSFFAHGYAIRDVNHSPNKQPTEQRVAELSGTACKMGAWQISSRGENWKTHPRNPGRDLRH